MANSQSYKEEIDSLKQVISIKSESANLASVYNALGFAYRRFSIDSLEYYTDLAIQSAEQNDDIGNLAKGYKNKGIAYYKNGSDYKKAINAYETGFKYAQQVNDYNTQVGCLNNIGIVYHTIYQFQTSLKFFYEALELYNENIDKNEFIKGLLLGNIGSSYRELNEREKEFEFIEKVIAFSKKYNHNRLYIIYCDDYIKSLHQIGESQRAISICPECLEGSEKINDYHSKTQTLITLAQIKYDLKEYDQSLTTSRQAEQLAQEKKFQLLMSNILLLQAKSLRKLENTNRAIETAKTAYQIGNEQNKFLQASQAALLLSKLYSEQDDYRQAYFYQNKYNDLSKENNDLLAKAQADELEAKYQVDNYLKTIDGLNEQNELQNKVSTLYIGIISLISLGFLFTLFYYQKSKKTAKALIKLNKAINLTQKELQEKHDELQAIFMNSYEGIVYKEINTDKLITCNQIALDLHGAKVPSDITNLMPLSNNPDEIIDGMPKEEYVAIKRDKFYSEGRLTTTWKFKKENGEIRHVALNAIIENSNKTDPKVIAFYRDITEEKAAKEALELRNKELEKYIESNIQLEQFAHVASHDLRAPLITINSFSKLLKAKVANKLDKNELQYLEFISSNGIQMFDLVNDLLEYSKINSQKIHTTDLSTGQLVKGVVNTLIRQAEEKSVTITIDNNMPSITADEIKIKRVFQNLLSNAIKFSDETKASYINISYIEEPDAHKFIIEDNGIGMRDHDVNIFLPYTQLNKKSDYKGTGMGLSFCHKIIVQHKGQIYYKSEFKKGTTFYFTISKNLNT